MSRVFVVEYIGPCFDSARWQGTLTYTSTQGVTRSLPFAPTLGHVFNHATHHRGQISAAITAMGHACPEIDWVWMLQADSLEPKEKLP